MSITPYKAVVPEDYTYLLEDASINKTFGGTSGGAAQMYDTWGGTTVSIDKTDINENSLSNLPEYDLVGEFSYIFNSGSVEVKINLNDTGSRTYKCIIELDYYICEKYRYVRFILTPNYTITNTLSGTANRKHINIALSVKIDGVEYIGTKTITGILGLAGGASITTGTYAFLFDTKTFEVTDITGNGTDLWSSRQ